MAGPVRPAYRSREAGEGGIDVCARVRPPSPRGRWVRCIRSLVIAATRPAGSARSAVVDPASATSGRRCWRSRTARSSRASRSAPPVAAGGDLVVNTSQTGYQEVCTDPSYAGQVVVMTYPLIGNYGRLPDDDQSDPAVAAGAGRGQRDGRGPRRCPPARGAPPRQRHPGHRRRRHAGAGAPPAGDRLPARRS